MKIYKLLFLTILSCFVISCGQDKFDDPTIDDSTYRIAEEQFDNSYLGVYKGLFSTNDGLTRGAVIVTLSPTNEAMAKITLSSGDIIELKSSKVKLTADNTISNLHFSSVGLSNIDASLNFSVEGNGLNPAISEVNFDNKASNIFIAKNLSRAPLTPITGTYVRTAGTGGFPTANRTWNIMSIGEGDAITFATQIFYGSRLYTTPAENNIQLNCLGGDEYTRCEIGGSASILGYNVTYNGTHTYAAPGTEACSGVSGSWASAYGNSSGTFVSDEDCSVTVTPAITASIDEILALPGEPSFEDPIDITDFVSFGQPAGVSSADWEVAVKIGDVINLDQPQGLLPGDKLWYDFATWFDAVGDPIDPSFVNQYIVYDVPPSAVSINIAEVGFIIVSDKVDLINIDEDADNDLNWKYDLIVFIERGGTFYGPYKIDPKIRIKSTNSL